MPQPVIAAFERDPQVGLQRLNLRHGQLPEAERRQLEAILRKRYPTFIHNRHSILDFKKILKSLAPWTRFHIRVRKSADPRSPSLVLEQECSLDPTPPTAVASTSLREAFFTALDALLTPEALAGIDDRDRLGLRFSLDQLRTWPVERSHVLAALLLAGYLRLAEETFQQRDPRRAALYSLAAQGLDRLLSGLAASRAAPGLPHEESGTQA